MRALGQDRRPRRRQRRPAAPRWRALGHDVRVLLPAYRGMKVERRDRRRRRPAAPTAPGRRRSCVPVKLPTAASRCCCSPAPALYQRPGGPYVRRERPRLRTTTRCASACCRRVAALLGTAHSPLRGWHGRRGARQRLALRPGAAVPGAARARWRRTSRRPPACSPSTTWRSRACSRWPAPTCWAIPPHWRGIEGVEFWGQLSMLKAGLQFADAITTVSPTYAREIQTPEHGVGLDGVLRARRRPAARHPQRHRHRGCGTRPPTRCCRTATSRDDLTGKAACKAALQARVRPAGRRARRCCSAW